MEFCFICGKEIKYPKGSTLRIAPLYPYGDTLRRNHVREPQVGNICEDCDFELAEFILKMKSKGDGGDKNEK